MNIREFLKFEKPYFTINREERNLAAIFYHALLVKDNLKIFLSKIGNEVDFNNEEIEIYFEYAFLRDLWNHIGKLDNAKKRELILMFLNLKNDYNLQKCTIQEFNTFFGAVPKPSTQFIQSPGNWSMDKFKSSIFDNDDFVEVCKFKWCFNAKPDIVINLSDNRAICIEAKIECNEGVYPGKESEKVEFLRRGLRVVKQTEIQTKIMKLLGIESNYLFLVQHPIYSETYQSITWFDAFEGFDLSDSLDFIKGWIKSIQKKEEKKESKYSATPIHSGYYSNIIKDGFLNNLAKLKTYFPAAYDFLTYPISNNTPIWLGSSVNVHLYHSKYFIAYIKIDNSSELIFSPHYNNIIVNGTTDGSGKLFPSAIQGLIQVHGGFKDGWARPAGDTYVIKRAAPAKFFNSLIKYLEKI